jgi:hypothetical protein
MKGIIRLLSFIQIFAIGVGILFSQEKNGGIADADKWNYKGICITGYWNDDLNSRVVYDEIKYFKSIGFNAIELVVTWYQDSMDSSKIYRNDLKTFNDADLKAVIRYCKKMGLKVNLKPHVDPYPVMIPQILAENFDSIVNKAGEDERKLLMRCYDKVNVNGKTVCRMKDNLNENDIGNCRNIIATKEDFSVWRARFNPSNTAEWFKNYGDFIKYYMNIAIETGADLITVGTELVSMTQSCYLKDWKDLMSSLRNYTYQSKHYKGKFMYAGHYYEIFGVKGLEIGDKWENYAKIDVPYVADRDINRKTKEDIAGFWKLFDMISMTVYFELNSELAEVVQARIEKEGRLPVEYIDGDISSEIDSWGVYVTMLNEWKKALNLPDKKVVFAELGYRSVDYGHYKPYMPDARIFDTVKIKSENRYNGKNQENAYIAMFSSLKKIDWLDGIFFWEEQVKNPPTYSDIENTGYSIIGKPASRIINDIFKKTDSGIPPLPANFDNSILGVWYYYCDEKSVINGTDGILKKNPDGSYPFRFIIDNQGDEIKQISTLSGTLVKAGYIGMGVNLSGTGFAVFLNNIRKAKGIRFKTKGDGKSYRCNIETENIANYNFFGRIFTAGAKADEVTVYFDDDMNFKQQDWGKDSDYKPFVKDKILGISFQPADAGEGSVNLDIWDMELLP